jgi:hypothetical protein
MSEEMLAGKEIQEVDSLDAVFEADIGLTDDAEGLGDTGSFSAVEDTQSVDYPHFRISTKDFVNALKISSIVSQGSGRELYAKAIGMEVIGTSVQIL